MQTIGLVRMSPHKRRRKQYAVTHKHKKKSYTPRSENSLTAPKTNLTKQQQRAVSASIGGLHPKGEMPYAVADDTEKGTFPGRVGPRQPKYDVTKLTPNQDPWQHWEVEILRECYPHVGSDKSFWKRELPDRTLPQIISKADDLDLWYIPPKKTSSTVGQKL